MDVWLKNIHDEPNLPEEILIGQLWNGKESKPLTAEPILNFLQGNVEILFKTEGASIGYKIKKENEAFPRAWSIYNKPFLITENTELIVQANRIGFVPSKPILKSFK